MKSAVLKYSENGQFRESKWVFIVVFRMQFKYRIKLQGQFKGFVLEFFFQVNDRTSVSTCYTYILDGDETT